MGPGMKRGPERMKQRPEYSGPFLWDRGGGLMKMMIRAPAESAKGFYAAGAETERGRYEEKSERLRRDPEDNEEIPEEMRRDPEE